MTGTLSPDATGHYTRGGMHDGQWTYSRDAGAWKLWWAASTRWLIGETFRFPGGGGPGWMAGVGAGVVGEYAPVFAADGLATVAMAE